MDNLDRLPEPYRQWGPLEFFVPGKPQPQGSKVRNRWAGVRDTNENLGPWRERVAIVAHQEMKGRFMLVEVPAELLVEFVMPRPTTSPKRWTRPAIKKPDSLKCGRAIEDALTGIVWKDDSQVTTHLIHKRLAEIGEEPGARIRVAVDLSCYFGGESPSRDGFDARKATG